MAFKMNYTNSAFPFKTDSIKRAKRLVRKNVGNTTVDAPDANDVSDRRFNRSERKIKKAVDILNKKAFSKEEIEQMTGAGGYQAAMDWATSKD